MIRINTQDQDIEYKGLFFPFKAVRKIIQSQLSPEHLSDYCIHKTFNTRTGQIERKYAWESVFQMLMELGLLHMILDEIIQKEYLED